MNEIALKEGVVQAKCVIGILNTLIERNRDAQQDFREAADNLEAQYIKTFCLDQSRTRARFVDELQPIAHSLSDEPGGKTPTAGTLRRGWTNLSSVLGGRDYGILTVVEFAEDQVVHDYQKALTATLPLGLRDILERQYDNIRQTRIKIEAMLDCVSR